MSTTPVPVIPALDATCPNCGAQLAPVALDPDTASWLCNHCALGFWSAELSNAARKDWRPKERDFGFARELRAACLRERTEARERGTSACLAHLPYLDQSQVQALVDRLEERTANPGLDELLAALRARLAVPKVVGS